MSDESQSVKKKKKPKPVHDTNGYWMKGSNGGHTGRKPFIWTDERLEELADDLLDWVDSNVEQQKASFLIGDWCYKVKMIPQHLSKFTERSPKLKFAHEYAKGWQEHMVCKGALFRKLDSSMAKFMLACHHGWRDGDDDKQQSIQRSNLQLMSEILHKENLDTGGFELE